MADVKKIATRESYGKALAELGVNLDSSTMTSIGTMFQQEKGIFS